MRGLRLEAFVCNHMIELLGGRVRHNRMLFVIIEQTEALKSLKNKISLLKIKAGDQKTDLVVMIVITRPYWAVCGT